LRAAGCAEEEITTRLSRSQQVLDEYAAHSDAFDYVIQNNGTKAELERQVLSLFAKHNNIQTPALEVAA
jgi:guanylate kinase